MSKLFICVSKPPAYPSEGDFAIEPHVYIKAIKERWSDVIVAFSDGDLYTLSWDDAPTWGGLQSNQKVVSFEAAEVNDIIEYSLWYRSLIPDIQPLFLFDDNLTFTFELKSSTTVEELFQLFKQHEWI
ncbi:MAG: hypothetical protein H7Y11_07770 [Armatimonadetes bacterium]|nr:hypothetical protein [Anaerolineae bacterium]